MSFFDGHLQERGVLWNFCCLQEVRPLDPDHECSHCWLRATGGPWLPPALVVHRSSLSCVKKTWVGYHVAAAMLCIQSVHVLAMSVYLPGVRHGMEAFQQALREVGSVVCDARSLYSHVQLMLGLDANVELSFGSDGDEFDSLGLVGPLVHPSLGPRSARASAFLAWCIEFQAFVCNTFPHGLGHDLACWTRRPWSDTGRLTQIDLHSQKC